MFEVLVQMAGLILCGVGWRVFRPAGLEPVQTRKVLTTLVYYLLLPALVLSVLWKADLGGTTLLIAASGAFATLAGLLLSMLLCRACKSPPAVTGGGTAKAQCAPDLALDHPWHRRAHRPVHPVEDPGSAQR